MAQLAAPSLGPWARLTLRALTREARLAAAPAALPLALRSAPPALAGTPGGQLPRSGLLAPVRSGIVLTREDLRARPRRRPGSVTGSASAATRLQAMLDQDAAATLGWLSRFARRWAGWHVGQQLVAGPDPRRWWADRAAGTAVVLRELQRRVVAAG